MLSIKCRFARPERPLAIQSGWQCRIKRSETQKEALCLACMRTCPGSVHELKMCWKDYRLLATRAQPLRRVTLLQLWKRVSAWHRADWQLLVRHVPPVFQLCTRPYEQTLIDRSEPLQTRPRWSIWLDGLNLWSIDHIQAAVTSNRRIEDQVNSAYRLRYRSYKDLYLFGVTCTFL